MTLAKHAKEYEFSAQALYNLLVHYTDGGVPLNGTVTAILQHPQMQRKIALVVESAEWDEGAPLFIQYDGRRVRSWSKGTVGDPQWDEVNETPRLQ